VDASEAMVGVCQRRYRTLIEAGQLELRRAKAESLPYPSDHFSKACTVNSLFYWADALQGLAEMYRVLEDRGRLVLCVTCKSSIESKRFAGQGLAMYEDDEILQMVKRAGFEGVEMSRAADRHREFLCIVGSKESSQSV
jgi:ubiquinone/menaquinone biosynthesis C-methylase UbiE